MSTLGDQLQDEIDAILALQTASEKGTGADGDPWAAEYEAYVQAVQTALNDAEADTHDHGGESLGTATTPVASLITTTANVAQAPQAANDVARQAEIDGHDHSGQALGGTTPLTSIDTEQLSNTPAEGVPQSLYSALSQGYGTALVPGVGFKTVAFSSFATDDAALQALVDWIETNHPNGAIYAPVITDDGTELTIENTVAQDPTLAVGIDFYFIGGMESQDGTKRTAVRTTITNGSPMFDLSGAIGGGATQGVRFVGHAWNLGRRNAGVVRLRQMNKPYVALGTVNEFYGDAVTFDSGCFVYRLDRTYFTPGDNQTDVNANPTPTARCVVTADSESASGGFVGSDGTITDTVSCEFAHAVGVANVGGHTRTKIQGHWEGAHGQAEIVTGAGPRNVGSTYVCPTTSIGVSNNGAHGIYHDGGLGSFHPRSIANIAGNGIHIGPNTGQFTIGSDTRYIGITGDAITVGTVLTGGTNKSVVPYEERVSGTVTYPASDWLHLFYPDGRQLMRRGTTTVPANTTVTANSFAGNRNSYKEVEITHAATPAGDTTYTHRLGVDASNGHTTLVLENLGVNDVDLKWVVYRRP